MRLTKLEMAQLELAETKGKLAEANLEAVKWKALYNQLAISVATKELQNLAPHISENESLIKEGKEQHEAVVAKAEGRLGIRLTDYTFNNKTGALSLVKSEENDNGS